jgi:hypothetical protein
VRLCNNVTYFDSIVRWAIQAQWAEPLVLLGIVLRLNYSSDYLFGGTFKLTSHNICLRSMSHYYKVSRFIQESMWQNITKNRDEFWCNKMFLTNLMSLNWKYLEESLNWLQKLNSKEYVQFLNRLYLHDLVWNSLCFS